jgi:hypothetical protein
VTLVLTGKTTSGPVVWRQKMPLFEDASTAVDRKSMGHTVAERSWKDADFLCISCI